MPRDEYHKEWAGDAEPELRRIIHQKDEEIALLHRKLKALQRQVREEAAKNQSVVEIARHRNEKRRAAQ